MGRSSRAVELLGEDDLVSSYRELEDQMGGPASSDRRSGLNSEARVVPNSSESSASPKLFVAALAALDDAVGRQRRS